MPVRQKTRAQLIDDLTAAIKSRDPSVQTAYGPAKDLVIDPVSLVVRDQYVEVQRVYDIQFIQNASRMDPADLDAFGESFGIKRKGPRRATGTAFFFTASKPGTDVPIPAGFPVGTSSVAGAKSVQSFITTQSATLFAVSAVAFFNPAAGVFEIEVPIRAVTPGADAQVPPGTITNMQRQIPGISGVTNKSATVGGRDSESNVEYARRIRLAIKGSGRGTKPALRKFVLTDDRVVDAIVVMSGDPLMVRDEDAAGAVDVYVLGEESTITTQTAVYDSLDIVFKHEPLIFPGPVLAVTGGIVGAFTEGVHYFVAKDSLLDGSTRARNVLKWNRAASGLPALGESITIEYVFDGLIESLQQLIESPDNDLLANVLIRRAEAVDIAISIVAKVTVISTLADLEGAVRSAITTFVNTRGLGESVVPSDLDVVIRGVPGIDFVVIPFTQLSKAGESGSDTVPIAKNQYPRTDDTLITVTLST